MEKNRQYRSNQGRSDEKVRKNAKLMFIVLISFFIVLFHEVAINDDEPK